MSSTPLRSTQHPSGNGDDGAALFLGGCVFRIGFDGDFHVRTLFEAYFLALVIRQGVVDAYFSIQMIPAFNGYLCLFGHAWEWGLDDFFYRSRQDGTRFFVHGSLCTNRFVNHFRNPSVFLRLASEI